MRSMKATLFAAALACAALAAPALAQAPVQCSETGTDEERIACLQSRVDALEAELARARGELAAASEDSPAPAAVEAPGARFGVEQIETPVVEAPATVAPAPAATAAIAPPAAATAVAEPAEREGRRWLRVPFFGRDDDEEAGDAPAQVAAAPAAPSATPEEAETFGAEQVAERSDLRDERRAEEEILRAQIVDFQVLHRGRLVVALDNGQMWRQLDVDSRQVRLREGESYPVEIRRSGFGGYRMKVADNDRIMSVERLR